MKVMHIGIVLIFGVGISGYRKIEKRQAASWQLSSNSEQECVIPSRKGSIYSNFITNQTLYPGYIAFQYEVVNEECEERYFNIDKDRYMICNGHGEWFPYISDKLCYEKCPPLTIENSNIQCTLNGISCDCSNFMLNGTRAIQTCITTHRLLNKVDAITNELHCLPDGKWDNELMQCVLIKPLRSNIQNTATAEISQSQSIGNSICILPEKEGTTYSNIDTNEILYPGDSVNQDQFVNEECKTGYYKTETSALIRCQKHGQWKIFYNDKLCLKMCPAMISDSLNFKCTFKGEDVDCSMPMKNGTTVIPNCKPTHHLANGEPYPIIILTCLPDGKWDQLFFQCVPFCGKVHNSNMPKPLLWNGSKAINGTVPWNVGLYKRQDQFSYDITCGGTLISEILVISAAHCFERVSSTIGTQKIALDDDMYKIGVGKYTRDILVKDNIYTRIVDASYVFINDYYGQIGSYEHDIAIVLLRTKIAFSSFVLPVCLHWKGPPTIKNGSPGKIAGWGRTNSMRQSPVLLETNLPYINRNTCYNMSTHNFRHYIKSDKFCAGSKSGPAADEGDSGAGLTFDHNNLHFLTGIVSFKDKEVNDSITVFTNVYFYIDWIRDIYVKYK